MIGLINPPGRYSASTKEWRQFLDQMKALPQNDPQVRVSIEIANKVLRERAQ